MIVTAESLCVLAGVAALMAGYVQANLWQIAFGCFVVGLLWLFSIWRRAAWAASIGLVLLTVAAGMGIWFRLNPILMAFGILGSLTAWDLADFSRRSRNAAPEDNVRELERKHLLTVAMIGTAGLVFCLAALVIKLQISFGWVFLLTIVVVIGLMQLANRFRRSG